MLNREQLLPALQAVASSLFADMSHAHDIAQRVWHDIVEDPFFIHRIRMVRAEWPVPWWETGPIDAAIPVLKEIADYTVLSVDGSQVYPDRHQGIHCFLINIGSVLLRYGNHALGGRAVQFSSQPYVFSGRDEQEQAIAPAWVNARRQEYELTGGVALYDACISQERTLLLYDGSLIFWHLEAQEKKLQETFLPLYIASLEQLYQRQALVASYISMPRSRELVNLIRVKMCDFDLAKTELFELVEGVVDTAIAQIFLQEGERSTVFRNNAQVSELYGLHLRPYFFYLHVGDEIGRVEIPAWIADDATKVDVIASILFDQCKKGRGYPVALAEAHEQAVVKGPDRDFFYHLLTKMGMEYRKRPQLSHKLMRKRGIGI